MALGWAALLFIPLSFFPLSFPPLSFSGAAFALPFDTDSDSVLDYRDNCLLEANAGQGDGDLDGRGTACDADLNQDLFVGGPDFTAYILCFGKLPVGGCAGADLNEDGIVDRLDFPQLLASFNRPPGPSAGAQVHGHVSSVQDDPTGGQSSTLRLPDITVFLEDVVTGRASQRAVTNPHGYFEIPKETIGEYRVCVEGTDFIFNCDPVTVDLTHEIHTRPDDYKIQPVAGGVIGEVLQRDPLTLQTSACFKESSYFQTLEQSSVTLLDIGGTPIRTVAANSLGQYLIPGVSVAGTYRLRGTCGTKISERVITVSSVGGSQLEDFQFANSRPKIRSLEVSLAGVVVQGAAAGDLVQLSVVAQDPDGDPLHYQWRSETAGFVSLDSAVINWQLPSSLGQHTVYLEVSDKNGGIATTNLSVPTGPAKALFEGIVSDRDSGLPISGATVRVEGIGQTTPATGGFAIETSRAGRYVLNAQKPGYAFVSQVFHASTVGLKIRMRSEPAVVIDPEFEVQLSTDPERNSLQANLTIPGDCLVGPEGNLAGGALNASFYTYDPQEAEGIPGDFSAVDFDGNDVRLESFGAFGIDVWDASNAPYTLAPGCEATFDTEVPTAMLSSAPSSIPLLEYDPVRGYWDEAAPPATLVGGTFRGTVPGFSSWNTDVTFADSACIKITVDESSIAYPFKIRVTIPTGSPPGTGVDKIKEFPVTESPNGLFRLPPNSTIKIEMIDDGGLGVVYKAINADSGAIVPAAFPPFPYSDCQGIDLATGLAPVVLGLDVPTHSVQWLSKKTGIYEGFPATLVSEQDQIDEANDYYDVIDPGGDRDTLTKWRNENGFPADEVLGVYYNNLDLKLGRQMRCRKTTVGANAGDVACAVSNFGQPGGPPQVALTAAIAHVNNSSLPTGATVTMEYDASLGSGPTPNQVKFYVFDPDGNRIPRVALDAEGEKPVPHICLVCHGGYYTPSTHSATGAVFREFDVFGFEFDTGVAFNLSGQQEAFRKLNAMVKGTNPNVVTPGGASAITDLIDGFYDQLPLPVGVDTAGALAADGYVPTDWQGPPDKSALYETIPKVHCRACHIAQSSGIDFNEYSEFDAYKSSIDYDVCTIRSMPHAEATFRNFWLSVAPQAAPYLADPGTGLGFTDVTCPK